MKHKHSSYDEKRVTVIVRSCAQLWIFLPSFDSLFSTPFSFVRLTKGKSLLPSGEEGESTLGFRVDRL